MNQRSWAAVGLVVLLAGCGGSRTQAPATQPTAPTITVSKNPPGFANPVVSPLGVVTVPPTPGLLESTNAKQHITGLTPGRPDPFAALTHPPIVLPVANRPLPQSVPKSFNQPPTKPPQATRPVPLPATAALPPIAPLPISPLPIVPPVALPSKTAQAEAIDITGAVQVAGRWQVIVKEPGVVSRYATVGDSLANGTVLIKKIIASAPGADPIVILQQNGVEITKSIGASRTIASR